MNQASKCSSVYIIIVNWNGKDDTLECLESVYNMDYTNFKVIVVDNGSSDNSVELIKNQFPQTVVLETGENLGFAGGNNVGIKYALSKEAEYILLLNNDTVVDSQLIGNLIKASRTYNDEGIFSAKIYFYSEPDKLWYFGAKWVEGISHFVHDYYGYIDNGVDFNSIVETDYACGCAMFLKTEIFNKIGLFDERFFLTFEETDFCYRAKQQGIKSYVVPDAKVWHKVSQSFGGKGSLLYAYYLARNRLLWAEKNLTIKKRIILYWRVFYETFRLYMPPRLKTNSQRTASFIDIYGYLKSFKKKYQNPVKKAKLLGVMHYLLRQFGNRNASILNIK